MKVSHQKSHFTPFYFICILTYINVYLMNNENALLLKWGNTM